MKLKINYLAVIILSIVSMGLNAAWYGIFAEPWIALNGFSEETVQQMQTNPGILPYITALISAFAMYWLLAQAFVWLKVTNIPRGLVIAVAICICFVFMHATTKNMFSNRPFSLTLIDEGITVIEYLLGGTVLSAWKKSADGNS